MQPTPGLEEIIQHRALEESHRYYGDGPTPARNPLQIIIDAELDDDREKIDRECEIVVKLLTYVAHDPQPGKKLEWVWKQISIKPGHKTRYIQADFQTGECPCVQLIGPTGEVVREWKPAMLKGTRKARPDKGEKGPSMVFRCLEWVSESFAKQMNTRLLSLAYLAGVDGIRDKTGVGLAKALGVTRQAVSLTNKAEDEKMREATGGKSGARGLRHKANPNKGKTKEQIQTNIKP